MLRQHKLKFHYVYIKFFMNPATISITYSSDSYSAWTNLGQPAIKADVLNSHYFLLKQSTL
jgi:hypothetical protein